jgi:hypothetical protein
MGPFGVLIVFAIEFMRRVWPTRSTFASDQDGGNAIDVNQRRCSMQCSTSTGGQGSLALRRVLALIVIVVFLPVAPTALAGQTGKRCRAIVDLVSKVEGLNHTFRVCKSVYELNDGTPLLAGLQAGFRGTNGSAQGNVGRCRTRRLRCTAWHELQRHSPICVPSIFAYR